MNAYCLRLFSVSTRRPKTRLCGDCNFLQIFALCIFCDSAANISIVPPSLFVCSFVCLSRLQLLQYSNIACKGYKNNNNNHDNVVAAAQCNGSSVCWHCTMRSSSKSRGRRRRVLCVDRVVGEECASWRSKSQVPRNTISANYIRNCSELWSPTYTQSCQLLPFDSNMNMWHTYTPTHIHI